MDNDFYFIDVKVYYKEIHQNIIWTQMDINAFYINYLNENTWNQQLWKHAFLKVQDNEWNEKGRWKRI